MLENLRRQGASIFIYLIFGLLIAIFVINIGPGSGKRGDGGCSGQSNAVITVDGYTSTATAYHVAYSGQNYVYQQPPSGRNRVYLALEALIQRELLANAAEERGIRITADTVVEEIRDKGRFNFYYAGHRIPLGHIVADDHADGTTTWNTAKFKRFVSDLNVSENSYLEEQARSMEAALMSELIQNSVSVSRDEALNEYLFNNTTVQYDVVAFRPDQYKSAMRLTDADLERYATTHEQEVKDRYKADERLYKARKPEMRLREIFIAKLEPEAKPEDKKTDAKPGDKKDVKPGDAKGSDAKAGDAKAGDANAGDRTGDAKAADKTADAKAADKTADAKAADKTAGDKKDAKAGDKTADAKAGDKKDAKTGDKKDAKAGDKTADAKAGDKAPEKKKVGMPIDTAKAKLEAARASIASGKQKFADAAKDLTTDDAKKATGGDLGWHTVDAPGFDDKAVNDAVKALKPGEMTPVIVTDGGVYLVMAEAKREGDLSYDQVKLEIARTLALDTWSKEGARRAALDALAKANAGTGKNLDQLFKRKVAPPQMTPEMQQMIEQQLQQQTGGGDEGPSGSIVYESKDIPAAWKDDAGGSSSGGTAKTPAAPAAPATGSAKPPGATPPTPMAPGAPAGATPPTPTTPGGATPPAPLAPKPGATPPAPLAPTAGATPAKPAQDLMTPSKDVLPAFGEVTEMVEKFGPVPRLGYLPGIGKSKEITTALFDELGPNQIAKKIYEVEGVYYVVQAAGKTQPKVEDFDKQAPMLTEALRARRGAAAVTEWLRNKCEALVKANKITPAPDMVRETDDNGKALPVVYRPCMTFK